MKKLLKNKTIRAGINLLLVGIVFYFIFDYIVKNDFLNEIQNITFNAWYLTGAILVATLQRFVGSVIWIYSLNLLGAHKINWVHFNYVYAKTWLAKFIPGQVTYMVGRVVLASQHGVSKTKLSVSGIAEILIVLITSGVLGFSFILASGGRSLLSQELQILLLLTISGLLITLIPRVFNYFLKIASSLKGANNKNTEDYIDGEFVLKMTLLTFMNTLLIGFTEFLILKSVFGNLGFNDFFFVAGAGILSGLIGMLAVFAPSGIGVKEGSIIFFLSTFVAESVAIAASFLSRFVFFLSDLLLFIVSYFLKKYKEK